MRQNADIGLKDRKVLVVGLAKTGVAVARLLKGRGAIVTATDILPASQLAGIDDLCDAGITVETGGHSLSYFLNAELIVLSPGVSPDIKPLREARKKGVEIISEIELAFSLLEEPVLAVTGTNGKTTTTTLLGNVLKDGGCTVFVGGNIGHPVVEYIISGKTADYLAVEVSSFQLEGIKRFKPYIAILLNITEDHLDRYANFDEYAKAKFRLFENMDERDVAIINIDDPVISQKFKNENPKYSVIPFSSTRVLRQGLYYKEGEIIYSASECKESYPVHNFKLKGIHNLENIMAVIAAARVCGIQKDVILKAIEEFAGLPHRMEFVRRVNGVDYYNDSKGTNIGALQKSLEGFDSPVVLIAGGKDKGGDYRVVGNLIKEKVKLLILLGEAKDKMREAFNGLARIAVVGSLSEAVTMAHKNAESGDVVLLSPACSSFDMFRDYKVRGETFKKLVEGL